MVMLLANETKLPDVYFGPTGNDFDRLVLALNDLAKAMLTKEEDAIQGWEDIVTETAIVHDYNSVMWNPIYDQVVGGHQI